MSIPDPTAETLPTPPNPYRFTVRFSPTPTYRAWAVRIYESDHSMQLMELCDTREEAEHHASLILSALHEAVME